MDSRKKYYTTVFCQAFSPCGKYLACGTNFGEIYVFSVADFCAEEDDETSEKAFSPIFKFQAHKDAIYCFVSTEDLLISGSSGEIGAWSWNDIRKRTQNLLWSLTIPQGNSLCAPEVNALAISYSESHVLFAGCGNNKVYCWDIETRALLCELGEHSDYIHALALSSNGDQLYTGSEDGSVKLWDVHNLQRSIQTIEPYKKDNLARPKIGKHISCVNLDSSDGWILLGGGPTLSVWHSKTLLPTTVLADLDASATVGLFIDDSIVAGGENHCVYHWSFNGDLLSKVPTGSASIYSIVVNKNKQYNVLTAAGSSPKIEVSTGNFLFKNFTLKL